MDFRKRFSKFEFKIIDSFFYSFAVKFKIDICFFDLYVDFVFKIFVFNAPDATGQENPQMKDQVSKANKSTKATRQQLNNLTTAVQAP